ncbi:HEAT repeat domain-containing protein [Deinococcus ficus]|uniref:HEAT repeat domain-containing protein n=1 Tax=Deinococcus ficus TaxID=317577 RepID=UPI0003B5CCAE|nr:HEAT repeat domain-containing protein [Deinococcus ficus]
MNLHPFHYRQVVRKDFSRDAYGRLIFFQRTFHGLGGVRPGTDPHIHFETTETDEQELIALTWREDAVAGLTWVQVTFLQPGHPGARQAFDRTVQWLQDAVPAYTPADLQAFARSPVVAARVFAVFATAIGAPWGYDAAVVQALHAAALDESPKVRAAVATATAYLGQTEYLPLLKTLANDEDPEVRDRAADVQARFVHLQDALRPVGV